MITLYLSTEQHDVASRLIRWYTRFGFSHIGFRDSGTGRTFSSMLDGGVKWRDPDPGATIKLATAPGIDEAFKQALTQEWKPYDRIGIAAMIFGRDWTEPDRWFCSELVAWSFLKTGNPLVNPEIDPCAVTPRDCSLSLNFKWL